MLDGQWRGLLSCGQYVGPGTIKHPEPWSVPVTLTVNGKKVQWLRARGDYSEELEGRLDGMNLNLTGQGHYNNAPDKPWRTEASIQAGGNPPHMAGDATIYTTNGQISRTCHVRLDKE